MNRRPNTIWLVAFGALAWLALPADAALGSIASDWDANEAVLKSVAGLSANGAGSSSSAKSKQRWQPEEEPVSIDQMAAALPGDGGPTSSSGASHSTSNGASSSIMLAFGQIVPDLRPAHTLAAEMSEHVPDPPTGGIFHPPKS